MNDDDCVTDLCVYLDCYFYILEKRNFERVFVMWHVSAKSVSYPLDKTFSSNKYPSKDLQVKAGLEGGRDEVVVPLYYLEHL